MRTLLPRSGHLCIDDLLVTMPWAFEDPPAGTVGVALRSPGGISIEDQFQHRK